MKTIKFRYSKSTPGVCLMLIFAVLLVLGSGVFMLLNHAISLDAPILPSFFEEHIYMIPLVGILPMLLWFVFAILPARRIWLSQTEEQGQVDLYENYADLSLDGMRLRLERAKFWIEKEHVYFGHCGHSPVFPNMEKYCIQTGGRQYKIVESYTEGFEKTTLWQRIRGHHPETSLALAMQELSFLILQEKGTAIRIKDVEIVLGMTTPAVFDGTPYYVDYAPEYPDIAPFASCWVREKADPEHVVGCLEIEDDPKHTEQLTEEILRTRSIVDGFEADERIEE